MTVTFYSNFLNHHQLPFCEAMVELIGDGFTFVACEPLNPSVVSKGYEDMNKAYGFVLRPYESEDAAHRALELARASDVIIHGSAPEIYIKNRMNMSVSKLTFRYSERIYKESSGKIDYITKAYLFRFLYYAKYFFNPLYLLASSAYTPYDYVRCGFRRDRIYKWGYFPAESALDIEGLLAKKSALPTLVWAGRMIGWKHPETVLELAKRLKEAGERFRLVMIGDGELKETIEQDAFNRGLEDCVEFLGALPAERVREEMEKSDIHIFTSDYNEGWGAVLNESMASACAPICAHSVGAAPNLITHGQDGYVYELGNMSELVLYAQILLRDGQKRRALQRAAYDKITKTWNARSAADAFVKLSEGLMSGKRNAPKEGPCSKAPYIAQREMYRYCIERRESLR